jgi:hypothetical protein
LNFIKYKKCLLNENGKYKHPKARQWYRAHKACHKTPNKCIIWQIHRDKLASYKEGGIATKEIPPQIHRHHPSKGIHQNASLASHKPIIVIIFSNTPPPTKLSIPSIQSTHDQHHPSFIKLFPPPPPSNPRPLSQPPPSPAVTQNLTSLPLPQTASRPPFSTQGVKLRH